MTLGGIMEWTLGNTFSFVVFCAFGTSEIPPLVNSFSSLPLLLNSPHIHPRPSPISPILPSPNPCPKISHPRTNPPLSLLLKYKQTNRRFLLHPRRNPHPRLQRLRRLRPGPSNLPLLGWHYLSRIPYLLRLFPLIHGIDVFGICDLRPED